LSVLGRRSALEAKDRIGYLPEERGVYRKMTVGAFLTYIARLKGMSAEAVEAAIEPILARIGLPDVKPRRCDDLSKGMLQRVQFAATIIHRPELLILDEPLSGLDPVSARLIRQVILEEHRRGATILLSTHVMPQAEEMCQHVVMIHKGRKVLDEPAEGLRRQFDFREIRFEPLDPAADVSLLRGLPGIESVEHHADGWAIRLVEGTEPADAIRRIAAVVAPARVELARIRLEDVFIRLVAEGADASESKALRLALQGLGAEGAAV
jgi:ABC-2 type transport system ATP-binding protein